jgi:riboflavin synthase
MFTGLIEEVGVISAIEPLGDGRSFEITAQKIMEDLAVDDSVAVNGVCLTVTGRTDASFRVTAVQETLLKTTLRNKTPGRRVNLERAVRLQDRLGGHIIQGHVDATGVIANIVNNEVGLEVWVAFPTTYRKWLIPVG